METQTKLVQDIFDILKLTTKVKDIIFDIEDHKDERKQMICKIIDIEQIALKTNRSSK